MDGRGFAIGAIVLMGLINVFFKEGGKYASNILALFKVAGMLMLIVIGSIQAVKNKAHSEASSIPIWESSHDVLDYVSALCFAFFAVSLPPIPTPDDQREKSNVIYI